jgi:uncharacterized protein YjbJ (UPF0337 family)
MNKDRGKAAGEKAEGKVNELVGKVAGDKAQEVKRKGQQRAGDIEKRYGGAKHAVRKND